MVKEIVSHIVHHVTKDSSAIASQSCIDIVKEYRLSYRPERNSKQDEQCRRHHQTIFVHWQVVMNTMKNEM